MTCELARELLEPLHDGELDAARQAEVREHLAGCASCTADYATLEELRTSVRLAQYYRAPAGLEGRIRRSLRPGVSMWQWGAIAAILLAGAFGIARVFVTNDHVRDAVVQAHVRSLIGTHLLDVPSSDQHTVKPWFAGKLDYAPDVRDFATQGFPLHGGRVEYLEGRRVAALVYQRGGHVINVFEWPSPSEGMLKAGVRDGYRVIHWTKGGMTWWVVSDLNFEELQQFAQLLQ